MKITQEKLKEFIRMRSNKKYPLATKLFYEVKIVRLKEG